MYFNAATEIRRTNMAALSCDGYDAQALSFAQDGVASASRITEDGMPEPFASQTKQPAAYRVCYTED